MSAWVKVERADELSEGMTVEIRQCGFCGKTERLVLLRPDSDIAVGLNGSGDFVAEGVPWTTAPGLCLNPRRPVGFATAIRDGRLFRLADDAPAAEETTTRKMERVR